MVAHADTSNPNALLLIEDLAESTGGFIVGGLTSSTTPKHHVSGSVTGGSVSGVSIGLARSARGHGSQSGLEGDVLSAHEPSTHRLPLHR